MDNTNFWRTVPDLKNNANRSYFFKGKKELKILIWSFQWAEGKTRLLHELKNINNKERIPFIPFARIYDLNEGEVNFNGINMKFWDIGGLHMARKAFRNEYVPQSDVMIYLIDSSMKYDNDQNLIVYNESCFEDFRECIRLIGDKPVLIVITKIDMRQTSTLDIIEAYHLENLYERKQKFGIIECSSVTLEGVKEILFWLSSIIN